MENAVSLSRDKVTVFKLAISFSKVRYWDTVYRNASNKTIEEMAEIYVHYTEKLTNEYFNECHKDPVSSRSMRSIIQVGNPQMPYALSKTMIRLVMCVETWGRRVVIL